jgi:hypothetical protein
MINFKKIIILLMAVSVMLTSCGKSAGLSNGGKKADNKIPAASPTPKPQPQKIDNYNIKQSLTNYVKDNIFVIGSITLIAIVIGSVVWIINKNKPTEPPKPLQAGQPELKGQSKPSVFDIRHDLGSFDYETTYLTYPTFHLEHLVNSNSCYKIIKQCAAAELAKRKFVPFDIPDDVDQSGLIVYSAVTNERLIPLLNDDFIPLKLKKAIEFILKIRRVIA